MEVLLSFCFFASMAIAIGLPLSLWGGYYGWLWMRQRRIRARALREACMICDGDVKEALDGTYQCTHCGFDRTWQDVPSKSAKVEEARELRMAVSEFQMGLDELERAVLLARANVWGVGNSDMKWIAVESAEAHFLDAHRMLQPIVAKHPELVDFPFPTELLAELSSGDRDARGCIGLLFTVSLKRRVRDKIAQAHDEAKAAVAVLEATLTVMGEEIQAA